MKAIQVKEGIYWVGAIDWSVRNFHGYTTDRGGTYGAYLIIDEKITLIDTVKDCFTNELIERVSDIVDPAKIDYIISNHVEMDHSGALPVMMELCKNATVITSGASGVKGLTAHYGEHPYQAVKGGDELKIGKRTLQFVMTPMLHWPDNMLTYCPEEGILFSNDAFGQHYASSGRFEDQCDLSIVMQEAKKYYANILMCYGKQAHTAWDVVQNLNPSIIAPSHGVIWRSHVKEILDAYRVWSDNEPEDGAVVVFDSMWHSTEKMAVAIAEAFIDKGMTVKLFDLKANHPSNIVPDILTSKYLAVGSPTLNSNMLPTVAGFLCYLKGLSPRNREAFAFGSFGWSGQSIKQVEDELIHCGFHICIDAIKNTYLPDQTTLQDITNKVYGLFEQND